MCHVRKILFKLGSCSNQYAKKYQTDKPTRNISSSGLDWSDTIFIIKSKWSIGFECPHPVIFSPFRILTICLIFKCYGNISKKTTMTFVFKMLKQIFLRTCFISCIFHCFCNLSWNSSVVSPTYCLPQHLHMRR